MGDIATGELGTTQRTLSSPSGALLPIRLTARAGDLRVRLRGMGALACGRLLGHHNLMNQWDVRGRVENHCRQLGRAGRLAVHAEDVNLGGLAHATSPLLAALRTTTTEPFGPGTAPRTSSKPLSASTDCTIRFWTVCCS